MQLTVWSDRGKVNIHRWENFQSTICHLDPLDDSGFLMQLVEAVNSRVYHRIGKMRAYASNMVVGWVYEE